MEDWISVKYRLPENGVVVWVKLETRVDKLKRHNSLWFLADDSMYVYYTPSHWKPLS